MQAEEIWFDDSIAARTARLALLPASGLYGAGFAVYRTLYDLGIKRPYRASIPVICVGNLAVGGSGKTPTTLHVADVLTSLGREVVVSASGYGSPRAEAATIAPEGPLDPREGGDEPAMMRWLRPDLRLVVGRRRPLAARLVAEAHPNAVMLMDDGFQHLPLAKSLTILLDPERPKNRFPLPAGPYRELRTARRRADVVLDGDTFRLAYDPATVRTPEGEELPAGAAGIVTAIARPERLLATVGEIGFVPGRTVLRPDHDPLDAPDLLADFATGALLLTTPKDWVKLSLHPGAGEFRWGIVHRSAQVVPRERFAEWLRERIGEGEE